MQCIGPCGYMVLIVCCLPLPSTVAKIYTLPLKSIPGYAAGGGVHFALLGLRDLEFMGIEKETIFIPIGKGKGSEENPLLLGDIAVSSIATHVTVPWSVCLPVCHVRALCTNGRR